MAVHDNLLNLLNGHVLSLWDEEDGEQDGYNADATEEEEDLRQCTVGSDTRQSATATNTIVHSCQVPYLESNLIQYVQVCKKLEVVRIHVV